MLAIDFETGIEDAWANVAEFVPKLAAALAVFLVGWIVARVIRTAVTKLLKKVRFDVAVDKSGLGAPLEKAGWKDSGRLLAQIIYYAVLLLTLQLAVDTFGDSAIQDALDGMVAFLPKLFVAIIIIVLAGAIASRVRELVADSLTATDFGDTVARIGSALVWTIGIFAAANQIEVAEDIVRTLFTAIVATIALMMIIMIIMFGVGGIKAAQDEFWPNVFARVKGEKKSEV